MHRTVSLVAIAAVLAVACSSASSTPASLGPGADPGADAGVTDAAGNANEDAPTSVASVEAGADAGDDGLEKGLPVVPGAKRMFATSAKFSGNLKAAAASATGLEGADKLCADAAQAAGLGGAWKAWLSDSTHDAIDRIADVGPWYLVSRKTKVFTGKTGTAPGSLLNGPLVMLLRNELGAFVGHATPEWTGTGVNGRGSPTETCTDWSSTDGQAIHGQVVQFAQSEWTNEGDLPCTALAALYCFEQ